MSAVVRVAAGALVDRAGRVLIAKRHADSHQGGLWEFPGGKLEAGEGAEQALSRELFEELGVTVRSARPLIQVHHGYTDRSVILNVYRVDAWEGDLRGREGQPLNWVEPGELHGYPMPAADRPVVSALILPDRYVITPPGLGDLNRFLRQAEALLEQGVRLLQFRMFDGDEQLLERAFRELHGRCHSAGAQLLFNGSAEAARRLRASGLHLSSRQLLASEMRPEGFRWVAASCHTAAELRRAEQLGLDFAVLSPVQPTPSHPDVEPLGWERFAQLVEGVCLPVYALGGMQSDRLAQAWRAGAQGVAGIRGFWVDEAF